MMGSPKGWLIMALMLVPRGAGGSAEKPHIVFTMVDDLGWANVGFHSDAPEVQTPTIDALAATTHTSSARRRGRPSSPAATPCT